MGKYVKQWQAIKAKFEADAKIKRPKESTTKAMLFTVSKASGLTPALEDIDKALDKKERLTLEKAMNKYHQVQEPYVSFVRSEMKKYDPDTDEDVVLAFGTFMREMLGIEIDVAKDAKALQEAKGGTGTDGIKWLFLEADVKATIEKSKKDFAAFAALEKRFNLIKKGDPAIKAAQDYTKAAARTEVANAIKALKDFQVKARDCAKGCDPAINDKEVQLKKNEKYMEAVKSFQKAMNDLASARAATQLKELEARG